MRMNAVEARREEEGKVRNSFVGEMSVFEKEVVVVADGVEGTSVPFKFWSARGSIDLRRRCPPRGRLEVSTR